MQSKTIGLPHRCWEGHVTAWLRSHTSQRYLNSGSWNGTHNISTFINVSPKSVDEWKIRTTKFESSTSKRESGQGVYVIIKYKHGDAERTRNAWPRSCVTSVNGRVHPRLMEPSPLLQYWVVDGRISARGRVNGAVSNWWIVGSWTVAVHGSFRHSMSNLNLGDPDPKARVR